ncbi:NAD(P)/FAD-dependent oxidoreductase [Defluviimonas sp. WL0024]|uniref:NAD(P)/FAD-dependent oxidoreductase n=1 Tax=Albidovulum salinarum TaxID=2984153 RepID=A0ABT2X1R3_9RHOB|nr:NAD(P)/FAD-dependent oxidoreductase [Defluviimonas sp. WL0024]MCU9847871.1 NAD(P)/FAD-dependent oxidoreductase [Defluviimonas sp. WL0024]
MEVVDTVVVGAGQAGLAASHELGKRGVDHLVLERDRIGAGWANRWEKFCLVTPNWSVQLPDFPYDGDDPDGFMPRDEIVAYLERYAASFGCPVRTGVDVTAVRRIAGGGFEVEIDGSAVLRARNLVVSTGAYQKPHVLPGSGGLPAHLRGIDISGYTAVADLPEGDVLIVGSGQTGCQLAEELSAAGRTVVLSCGRAPWAPRRIGERDLMWWLIESGFLDVDATTLPPEARLFANVLASGHGGGHDLHYRTLAAQEITLVGRFLGVEGDRARFAPDLAESVAWGDEKFRLLRDHFAGFAATAGIAFPDLPDPEPFEAPVIDSVDLRPFGTVIFTGGFRPDYLSWLPWPEAFDADGFPLQSDGASTAVPGLYFVGLHFMRTRRSALLCGVGDDARVVARQIAGR